MPMFVMMSFVRLMFSELRRRRNAILRMITQVSQVRIAALCDSRTEVFESSVIEPLIIILRPRSGTNKTLVR